MRPQISLHNFNLEALTQVIVGKVERKVEVDEGDEVHKVEDQDPDHEAIAPLHLF
jgi:hypothetical protein